MKLLQVGKTKIKYEKKDGSTKTSKVTPAVATYAKTNLVGKEVKPTFGDNGVIIKLVERTASVKRYSNFDNYSNKGSVGGNSYKMVERSVFSAVCNALTGIDGVTVANVKKLVNDLYKDAIANVLKDHNKKTVEENLGSEEENLDDEDLDDELGDEGFDQGLD